MAKDFEHTGTKTGEWHSKPAKRALETLFMQGDLMASKRINFHKVYDLTERVLPQGLDLSIPSPETHARFLITRYLQANGLGTPTEICYLLKGVKARVTSVAKEMRANGELIETRVNGKIYYALPTSLSLLNRRLPLAKLKLLSPFDNLLIQPKRPPRGRLELRIFLGRCGFHWATKR